MASGIPLRLLPCNVDLGIVARVEGLHSRARPPDPPRYDELEREGLIAPGDHQYRWFSDDEQHLARWLDARGTRVVSVERREGRRERTPDAVLPTARETVEFKRSTPTATAVARSIRSGRGQSRRVLVDIRGPKADVGVAVAGMNRAVRLYGLWLDEVVVVVTDDWSVGWWHGRDPRPERRVQGGLRR